MNIDLDVTVVEDGHSTAEVVLFASFTFVARNKFNKAVPVPALAPNTEEEKEW